MVRRGYPPRGIPAIPASFRNVFPKVRHESIRPESKSVLNDLWEKQPITTTPMTSKYETLVPVVRVLRARRKCFLLFRGISRVQVHDGFYNVQLRVRTTGVCRQRRGWHDYVRAAVVTAVTDSGAFRRHDCGRGIRICVAGAPARRSYVPRATMLLLLLLAASFQQGHRSLGIVVVGRVVNGAVRPSICTLFLHVTDCSHRTVTWNGFMFLSLTRTGHCSKLISNTSNSKNF